MIRLLALLFALASTPALAQTASLVIPIAPTIPPSSTAAGLPTCAASTTGWACRVTDSLAPTLGLAVVGGGAVAVVVRCNGTSWLVGQ